MPIVVIGAALKSRQDASTQVIIPLIFGIRSLVPQGSFLDRLDDARLYCVEVRVFNQTLEFLHLNLLNLALIKFLHLLVGDLSILKQAGHGYVCDLIEHHGLPADVKLDHARLPVLNLQHELGAD